MATREKLAPSPAENGESLLFRFNSFQIIGFTHFYCWPMAWLDAGCLVRHRERINAEDREIEIMTGEHQSSRDLSTPPESVRDGNC